MGTKLAIIATHPIQYYAPWFAFLASAGLRLRVFYLWDFGVASHIDTGFRVPVQWDIPLLDGYEYEFVQNRSRSPGTSHYFGLWNPDLSRRVRAYCPDAVLLTAYNFASIGYFLLGWTNRDCPLIFRGDSHRLIRRRGFVAAAKRKALAAIFERFSAVLYVGSANREYFVLHGVPDERLFSSPHAVDNQRFFAARESAEGEARAWKRSLGIGDEQRVVLFAGKLEKKKRPLDLLEAFHAAGLDRTSLLYVGSGPQEGQLRAAATRSPNVHFAPFRNQSLMPSTYAAGDVFVLPSFGSDETWGLAVNEAMCMGRPVIASDHVGCARDLVSPYKTGLTFTAGNVESLRAALQVALEDPARLKKWGDCARSRIGSFSYESASAGLFSALRFLGTGE